MATNSSPRRNVRESIETPATRARGSSPVPAPTPRAPATCAIVHRINASRGLLYADTPRIGLFSPYFEGSSFRELTPGSRALATLSSQARQARYVPNFEPFLGSPLPISVWASP